MDLVRHVADAYLQTAEGSDAARLRFLGGLWEIQSAVPAVEGSYVAPEGEALREALMTGRPLFLLGAPHIPVAEYIDVVSRIARYVSETAGLPTEQSAALRETDFAAAIRQEDLADVVASTNGFLAEVASRTGAQPEGPLTPATVAFVLISALVPFLEGPSQDALEALGELDQRVWAVGICPVCGAPAAMGQMGESTQLKGAERKLWCGLCHAEWGYARIQCVRCGTRNPDKLRYSHPEGDPAHRLHLCDECHGYTRFVFTDDLDKPVSMAVEDAVAAVLDAAAFDMGYTATGDGGAGSC